LAYSGYISGFPLCQQGFIQFLVVNIEPKKTAPASSRTRCRHWKQPSGQLPFFLGGILSLPVLVNGKGISPGLDRKRRED
jgi:hypothetical protein